MYFGQGPGGRGGPPSSGSVGGAGSGGSNHRSHNRFRNIRVVGHVEVTGNTARLSALDGRAYCHGKVELGAGAHILSRLIDCLPSPSMRPTPPLFSIASTSLILYTPMGIPASRLALNDLQIRFQNVNRDDSFHITLDEIGSADYDSTLSSGDEYRVTLLGDSSILNQDAVWHIELFIQSRFNRENPTQITIQIGQDVRNQGQEIPRALGALSPPNSAPHRFIASPTHRLIDERPDDLRHLGLIVERLLTKPSPLLF